MDILIFHFIAMTVFFQQYLYANCERYFIPNADYLAHHGQMKVYTIYNGRFIFRKEQQKTSITSYKQETKFIVVNVTKLKNL